MRAGKTLSFSSYVFPFTFIFSYYFPTCYIERSHLSLFLISYIGLFPRSTRQSREIPESIYENTSPSNERTHRADISKNPPTTEYLISEPTSLEFEICIAWWHRYSLSEWIERQSHISFNTPQGTRSNFPLCRIGQGGRRGMDWTGYESRIFGIGEYLLPLFAFSFSRLLIIVHLSF